MKRFFLFFAFLALIVGCKSVPKNVMIGKSNGLQRGICEPSIVINPKSPNNVVAAAILDRVFYSFDGGKTWKADTLKSSYGVWGDPVLVADTKGNIYYLHLSDPTGKNWLSEEILDRIVCQKSTDGGMSFNNGSYMGLDHPKDQDKQWAVTDTAANVYATWTQFDKYGSKDPADKSNILFSKSTDQGETWSKAMRINQFSGDCLDGDNTTEGAVPAVDLDGNLYVSWSYANKIYFDRSYDGGQTWLEEDIVVADQPGGWEIDVPGLMRANGMPVTMVNNNEGPHQGDVYVCWVDEHNGNYDVWFTRSKDKGNTWSKRMKVNTDVRGGDQFFCWMDVDQVTGQVYIIYYGRKKANSLKTQVFLASSKDGGLSWENERISKRSFTPNPKVFFGDYNHISVHDGMVRPIWTRYDRGGKLSIWTALINKKAQAAE
jgi:hypothetical protein